eukprot:403356174
MSQRKNNALSEQTKSSKSSTKQQSQDIVEPQPDNFFTNPTFFGMDYFRVIYGSAFLLVCLMVFVFITVEDEKMRRMTMVQGGLSVFLILVTGWYHGKVEKKKQDRAVRQARFKKE